MTPFRVLNWNLLHSLGSTRLKNFPYCKPEALNPKRRVALTTDYINTVAPDLVCLQELDHYFLTVLEEGLKERLVKAVVTLNDSIPSKDGVGIFYNPSRFTLTATRTVHFRDVLDEHLPQLSKHAGDSTSAMSLSRALYRETKEKLNMVVMAKLRDNGSGCESLTASTHLFWDPAYPDIKLLQAYLFAMEIDEFAGTLPVAIGADLNSLPGTSAVYELLMGSGIVSVNHPQHPVTLRSRSGKNDALVGVNEEAVPELRINPRFVNGMRSILGHEPEYTNFTSSFKGCLDYVMLRNMKSVRAHPLPVESILKCEVALPNTNVPSDHLPLVIDVDM